MRKLMWFAVGFAAACAGGAYLQYGIWIALAAICVCTLILSKYRREIFCILLGCAVGASWFLCFDLVYLAPVRAVDGQLLQLDITATDYSRTGEYGISCCVGKCT